MALPDRITVKAAKAYKTFDSRNVVGEDRPLWVQKVQEIGLEKFIGMVEANSSMDDVQKHTCRIIVARLLATNLGMQLAVDLQSEGTAAIDQYLEHLWIPRLAFRLFAHRQHALARKGWGFRKRDVPDGRDGTDRTYDISHPEWTKGEWWNENDFIHTQYFFTRICCDLDMNNFNERLDDMDAINRTFWQAKPCELGVIEFIELVTYYHVFAKIRPFGDGKPLPMPATLNQFLANREPMKLDEVLRFNHVKGKAPAPQLQRRHQGVPDNVRTMLTTRGSQSRRNKGNDLEGGQWS